MGTKKRYRPCVVCLAPVPAYQDSARAGLPGQATCERCYDFIVRRVGLGRRGARGAAVAPLRANSTLSAPAFARALVAIRRLLRKSA